MRAMRERGPEYGAGTRRDAGSMRGDDTGTGHCRDYNESLNIRIGR